MTELTWTLDQYGTAHAANDSLIELEEHNGEECVYICLDGDDECVSGWIPIRLLLHMIRKFRPGADPIYLAAQQFVRAIESKDKGLKKYTLSELVRLVKAQP